MSCYNTKIDGPVDILAKVHVWYWWSMFDTLGRYIRNNKVTWLKFVLTSMTFQLLLITGPY